MTTTLPSTPPAVASAAALVCGLAPERAFGTAPAAGWQRLSHLTRYQLAPSLTHRPLRLLGDLSAPQTSLSGLSSVHGRLGLWLQDSPAFLDLLRLVFSGSFMASSAPSSAPGPDTTADLVWQQLSLADEDRSVALVSAYSDTGPADLFTGLRASALQLSLDPAAPPVAELTLIGQRHTPLSESERPVLPAVAAPPDRLPTSRLAVRVNNKTVPFPVQLRLTLSFTPARPHYSLGGIRPDRISLGLPRATASLSFWLSDRLSLGWTEKNSQTSLGLTVRVSASSWLCLDMPAARVLASRHTHRGAAEAVLSQVDFELGAGLSVCLARLAVAPPQPEAAQ